jgi:hypothetical protein
MNSKRILSFCQMNPSEDRENMDVFACNVNIENGRELYFQNVLVTLRSKMWGYCVVEELCLQFKIDHDEHGLTCLRYVIF